MRAEVRKAPEVWLVVPDALDTLTGGYLYDRRMLEELARLDWNTRTLSLGAGFASPGESGHARARAGFDAIADGGLVVIDGLALAGLLPVLPEIIDRLEVIALIHHPLADETGIAAESAVALEIAEKSALALVKRVIVTSPWTRRRLADYDVAPARIAVVAPGIDRGSVATKERSSTAGLLTVATLTPRKGHAMLIEALARSKDLDWTLRCAGSLDLDRSCAEALRAQIDRAELSDRVMLLGELSPERIRGEYARADLFVLPSYLEGFGMALAEAIAHGLPVVSTTAGAIPDTVPDSAARLVPPGDVDALAEVLRELIGDRAARERLALGARDAADSAPSWAQAARKFAAVLNASAKA